MKSNEPTTGELVVAAVQMNSRGEKKENLRQAIRMVTEAVERGAALVALPEYFNCLTDWKQLIKGAEPIPGPTSQQLCDLAARLNVWLLAGSIAEATSEPERAFNSSLLIGPDGRIRAKYRKQYLFDVHLPTGVQVRESKHIIAGDQSVVTPTPWGNLGQATCYDLRFPELFRELADAHADFVLTPSAFARATGKYHWEILLRARAIENQVYVVAPNQCGSHTRHMESYGNSMIVDPWGNILARAADDREEVILAELKRETIDEVRQSIPCLDHRRNKLACKAKTV